MQHRPSPRASVRRALVAGAAALALPLAVTRPLPAQSPAGAAQPVRGTGSVVGTVADEARQPLDGAQVTVVGTRLGAVTGADGRFRIAGVPAGTYALRVQRLGQRGVTVADVVVRAGEATTANAQLVRAAATLGGVVVSASRRVEKVTDAPATITSIGTDVLDASVGNIFAGALKEAKGLDFIQVGMTSVAINARGFNSSFNNRFLMVEDGRIAVLPENGLPVGQFTATPKVDLAGMEVLVGPGSALYGPDASNGVLSLRTKDPRQFPGATLEVTGGNRNYMDVQGRYAGVRGNIGYKVSGEFQRADDWNNFLSYNAGGTIVAPGTAGAVAENRLRTPIDWTAQVARGTGAVVWYRGDSRLEVSGGVSRTDGVGQTNVGRNQLDGWLYNTLQARWTMPHWYVNVYRTQSQSGRSFALNRFAGAQLTPANANLSADSLRLLADWPSDGRMYAAEVQGNYTVPALLGTNMVFGAQYRADVVSSDRQWLTDRNSRRDINNTQAGVYAQTTTPVTRFVDVVLAGRLDDPSVFARQWSPKAGVVVKPMQDQALRVTFNRAYKSPTILQTNFFIPDWTSLISIYGNTTGFTVRNAAGAVVGRYDPVTPETNRTWEYGYKGVFAERLYVDATYFHSRYDAFLSPLSVIANPFGGAAATFAAPTVNPGNTIPVNAAGLIVNQQGATPIMLTYYNLGRATVSGTDLGVNYFVSNRLELRSTLSTVNLRTATVQGEATSLNSPATKWTVGASAREVGPFAFGATWRNVGQYYFRSGSNSGVIPTFGTLDATASLRLPNLQNAMLSLGVSNLFTCSARDVRLANDGATPNARITSQSRGCGFGRPHTEMINMPQIGGMAFLGLRLQR